MQSQTMLLSSKFRDRILYPNPCSFIVASHVQQNFDNTIKSSINPTTSYPVYNFSFPSLENFALNIISMKEESLLVNDDIFSFLGKIQLNDSLLTFPTLDSMIDILRGFYIEISIADTIFFRKIENFDPTNKKITIEEPFPFVMNDATPISCFLTNRNTSTSITCNGPFLAENRFLYEMENLQLYNIRENEMRKVISIEKEVLHIETAFSSFQKNDQYLVFLGDASPKYFSTIKKQTNDTYHSYQFGRIQIIKEGSNYQNGEIVILKPIEEEYDSNFSYHEYKIQNLKSKGNIISSENIVLSKIGNQVLQNNTSYEIMVVSSILPNSSSSLLIKSLLSTFHLNLTSTIIGNNVEMLKGQYLFPLLYSSQYTVKNSDLYIQPNQSILPHDEKLTKRNLIQFELNAGLFPIVDALLLENDEIAVTTRLVQDFEKLTIIENKTATGLYQGITNVFLLDFLQDSASPININTMKKEDDFVIGLKNVVLPNLPIKNANLYLYELPYILFDLKNTTQATNLNANTIFSNNKMASKNKFILYIPQENLNQDKKFLTLSCESCQEIEFNPYDSLQVEIRLPSGDVIEFDEKEYAIPVPSNDHLECILLLEIKKKKLL
jgi:hypothetical protein